MPFCPQNSWPSFGKYICVNPVILDVPDRHSVNIVVFSTFRLRNSGHGFKVNIFVELFQAAIRLGYLR